MGQQGMAKSYGAICCTQRNLGPIDPNSLAGIAARIVRSRARIHALLRETLPERGVLAKGSVMQHTVSDGPPAAEQHCECMSSGSRISWLCMHRSTGRRGV